MKILLANKFYYAKGGDCIYALNLEQLLKQNGHEVAFFAIEHSENLHSEWSHYFPSEVSYASTNVNNKLKSALRPLGSYEVKKSFKQLLNDFQPDIVHLSNIHTHLSPIIAEIASKKKIKVIWTLHDYKLLCPRSDCLRHNKYNCEICFNSKINVVKYRCTKDSLPASFLAYFEALKWNQKKLEQYTSSFICPSEFMKKKMIQGGFQESKLNVLHNFIDIKKVNWSDYVKSDYYCYIGRISVEKGIETLLEAAKLLPFPLKIIGSGPQLEYLQTNYRQTHIEFLGQKSWEEIKPILGKARFSVIPSMCYENNPLAALESLCLGTPILGADMGGIPELVEENFNGLLFESGNVDDLKNKIDSLFSEKKTEKDYRSISEKYCNIYSSTKYYDSLMKIYEETY